jgi:hypothetical protein
MQAESEIMYAYHDQDVEHNLIFRYDDAGMQASIPKKRA